MKWSFVCGVKTGCENIDNLPVRCPPPSHCKLGTNIECVMASNKDHRCPESNHFLHKASHFH